MLHMKKSLQEEKASSISLPALWYAPLGLTVIVTTIAFLTPVSPETARRIASGGAAVGVSMSVAPNPYNTVAFQLRQKEVQLEAREKELEQKEQTLGGEVIVSVSRLLWGGAGFLVLLMSLIFHHLYLDKKRFQIQPQIQ